MMKLPRIMVIKHHSIITCLLCMILHIFKHLFYVIFQYLYYIPILVHIEYTCMRYKFKNICKRQVV